MPTPPLSAERQEKVRELLAQGWTHDRITEATGVSNGSISRIKRCAVPHTTGGGRKPASPVVSGGLPETHLLLPDMHFPEMHLPTWRAVLDFLNRNRVAGITWSGDQLDLGEISHWNRDKPALRGKGALRSNLDEYNALLDEIDKRLSPSAIKRWHRGNHERFIQDYYQSNPELEGMLDLEEHLRLKERGYEVYKLGEMSKLGKLGVIHGDSVGSGKYIAAKLVETHCRNIVMGHVHTASSATKVSASDSLDKWMAWTLPTMGTTNPLFAKNRPSSHVNGFGIVEVFASGQFNLYTIITDPQTGAFAYGGQMYSGA